ncbi:MAG: hypothetical protein KDC80_17730 [Saprospiraceae bacterium]|nr:hypothetical protein [Saprospiraceae bacterium]
MIRNLLILFVCCLIAKPNLSFAQLPAPIQGQPVHPDSIQPPVVTKMKGEPIRFKAHPNVVRATPVDTHKLPKNLKVVNIGTNGVPGPRLQKAEFTKIPVTYPEPVRLAEFRIAKEGWYTIKTLTENEGFEAGSILSFLEDSRGHIWMGHHSGAITRLDGENVHHFSSENGFPVTGGVVNIIEDRQGRIWFAGAGGVCYFDGHDVYHYNRNPELLLFENTAGAILEDRQGNIWFDYKDLYCYDGENFLIYDKSPAFVNAPENNETILSGDYFTTMIEDREGYFWFGTAGNGVLRFDGEQVVHITESNGLMDNNIGVIFQTSTGEFWFGSGGQASLTGKGISRFVPDPDESNFLSGTLINYDRTSGFSDNRFGKMTEDSGGNLWFALYQGGINRYDGETITHISKDQGLSSNNYIGLYLSDDNVLWTGGNGGAINQIFPNTFRHFTKEQGVLSTTWVNSITEDIYGNNWMASAHISEENGLIRYNGQFFDHINTSHGLPPNFIMKLVPEPDGYLWIATRDNGIIGFDGEYFAEYGEDQGLIRGFVWDLTQDKKNTLWLAQGHLGVTRINPENSSVTHFVGNPNGDGIGGGQIFQDQEGILWLGGREYVTRYNEKQDRLDFVARITTPDGAPNPTQWVDFYLEDADKNLWVGNPWKFIQVRAEGTLIEENFPSMTRGVHWPDVLIQNITFDHQGRIWLTSNSDGLFCLPGGLPEMLKGNAQWYNFKRDDGLKTNAINNYALHIDSQNRLWICINDGVTYLDLNDFEFPVKSPQGIGIIDLEINGQSIHYGNINNDTSSHELAGSFDSIKPFFNLPEHPDLAYNENSLTFHFSANDWKASHRVQYKFMLEGFDKEWNATDEAKVTYRQLPAGRYSFKVKAIGESNQWSTPSSYTFSIRPPWWLTIWAYFFYSLVLVGSIGGYILYLRRKVRLKQEQLEREKYLNRELKDLNLATTKFVPRDFIKILNKESIKELQLGDQTDATMTVLFADIRGYTELSESMTPRENFKFINAYVGRMGPIIREHGGFICQYYGDGIMALFKENSQHAISASVAMQRALEKYNRNRRLKDREPVRIGIGLNTGHLMLGVIGDASRFDTSVISDAVNTASRLEGLTRVFGSQIILSETTLKEIKDIDQAAGESDYLGEFRFLGKVKVKGKDQIIKIYEIFDGEPELLQEQKRKTSPGFEKAIRCYFDRDFGKAADILKEIAHQAPDDMAAQYYLERSIQYVVNGVEENWSGAEVIINK